MVIETLENGDYITLEKDCIFDPQEIYTRYDKNGNFICSWWNYIPY